MQTRRGADRGDCPSLAHETGCGAVGSHRPTQQSAGSRKQTQPKNQRAIRYVESTPCSSLSGSSRRAAILVGAAVAPPRESRGQGRHPAAGQHQRPELERARLRRSCKSLEPHGFKTAYSENVADADEAEALRDYASQGYNIVMGHSGRFVSAMEQVAPDFPKVAVHRRQRQRGPGAERDVDRLEQCAVRLPDSACLPRA